MPLDVSVHQGLLLKWLNFIFPGKTQVNARKGTALKYPTTGAYLELDIWIPDYQLAFEFQDLYHYTTTWYANSSIGSVQLRDDVKRRTVLAEGNMDLVIIPCWWDGALDSLIGTINFSMMGITDVRITGAASVAYPIPLNPPNHFFPNILIPNVGELMLASFPLHSKFNVDISMDNSWWMGEKYDGIRCCWNPLLCMLYTRHGRVIQMPTAVQVQMSRRRIFMDAEIWFGRGAFSLVLGVLMNSEMVDWSLLRVPVFDEPLSSWKSYDMQYEARYARLMYHIPNDHAFALVVPRVLCTASTHLNTSVQDMIDGGGEGIILRKPASLYERGRNSSLVKIKAANSDMEAMVIDIASDKSVKLLLPNDRSFTVPPHKVHLSQLKPGLIVTFTYSTFARREVPADAEIIRIRRDVSWLEIKQSFASDQKYLNESSMMSGFVTHPTGHWTTRKVRAFLEQFAKKRKMDPLRSDTWYNTTRDEIMQTKGGRALFSKLKGGYFQVLTIAFPDVEFDKSKFPKVPPNYWDNIENRRKFFEKYAKEKGFSPLSAESWYSQPLNKIAGIKGAAMMLVYHNYSVARALVDLFPNIGLDKAKFSTGYKAVNNRRNFFVQYARKHGFDPLVSDNWYRQPAFRVLAEKGAERLVSYYNNSVAQAIASLFPNIEFDPLKFNAKLYWADEGNRRRFFEDYAHHHGFDPHDVEAWYKQSKKRILATKDASKVLRHHSGTRSALLELFPDIVFDRERLFPSHSTWGEPEARIDFFKSYAERNKFDHLLASNWYEQPSEKIMAVKGADRVMSYHGGDFVRALIDLFPNIGLDKNKFTFPKLWKDIENRRSFFYDYAAANGFDANDPAHWYAQQRVKVMAFRGANKVVLYHRNSLSKALLDLFPNIGLVKSMLHL